MVNDASENIIENEFAYEVVIGEMKYLLEQQYQGIEATKSTAQNILGSASLIIALIGGLQLLNVQIDSEWVTEYNLLLKLSIGLYIALILCCVLVIKPVKLYAPTSANLEEIYEKFLGHKTDLDVLKQQLANYLNVLSINEKIVKSRSTLATIASVLLPIIVVILFVLSAIPRTSMPTQ